MLDDLDLCPYGTPLPPIEEDTAVPSKKPIHVQDQIVTDENGRRRFHGAFTGGFSAGYWNTVGSHEGWQPQTFKSSRKEKAPRQEQKPEDFMDSEDLGEFGIAPQIIRPHEDYEAGVTESANERKRKLWQPMMTAGPIPGAASFLHDLLKPLKKDKVAVRILKSWGWRPGQGAGPRLTRKEKRKARERRKQEQYLREHYGCAEEDGLRSINQSNKCDEEEEEDSSGSDEYEGITFAPDDYTPYVAKPKEDRFGLGYQPLSRHTVLSSSSSKTSETQQQHFSLFEPLEILDRKLNKKFSIQGQAFGVGALEEEDEDIYARDDMTKYDFSLEDKRQGKKSQKSKACDQPLTDALVLEGFVAARGEPQIKPQRFDITLPPGYKPRNLAIRKTRFEPLDPERAKKLEDELLVKVKGLGRHALEPEERGRLLGEPGTVVRDSKKLTTEREKALREQRDQKTKDLLDLISRRSTNFTQGGLITAQGEEQKQRQISIKLEDQDQKHCGEQTFKPFLSDPDKQARYESFIAANIESESDILAFLNNIQPIHLSAWEREMEMKEFIQARKIYKPLKGVMSNRFVTEAGTVTTTASPKSTPCDSGPLGVRVERTRTQWRPHSLLCKRFNIPEPHGGALEGDYGDSIRQGKDGRKKSSSKGNMSVFDYLEDSVNSKKDFQTPVIIPNNLIEKVNNSQLVWQEEEATGAGHSKTEMCERLAKPSIILTQAAKKVSEEQTQKDTAPVETVDQSKSISKTSTLKTELERRCEEARSQPAAEKLQLFRAIFEDSDDDESNNDNAKIPKEAKATTSTGSAPSGIKPTSSASTINFLRNNSPPRGIFAALMGSDSNIEQKEWKAQCQHEAEKPLVVKEKVQFTPKNSRAPKMQLEEASSIVDVYGPRPPPATGPPIAKAASSSNIDRQILRLLEEHSSKAPEKGKSNIVVEEQWIERSITEKDGNGDEGISHSGSSSSNSSSNEDEDDKAHKKSKKHRKHKKHKFKNNKKKKKSKRYDRESPHKSRKHRKH